MIPKFITIHCSATRPSWSDCDVEDLRHMHTSKGWSDIGYHWVITRDGIMQVGRPMSRNGAGVKGHNANNIHICLIGGVDEDNKPVNNFTGNQFDTLRHAITSFAGRHGIREENIKGHRDWPNVAKECPCFDVQDKLQEWKI